MSTSRVLVSAGPGSTLVSIGPGSGSEGSSGGAAAGRTLSSRGRGEYRGVSGIPPTTGCDLRLPPAGRRASCARSPGEPYHQLEEPFAG